MASETGLFERSREILETLIAFDTTSRNSNLALIEWVEAYLAEHGVEASRVSNEAGDKANLYATVGPSVEDGVILSGHSDTVPVDGQDWATDPFVLTEHGDKWFGRGTCDMKAFIALALAAVPLFKGGAKPVHLTFSHDEEVGCKGCLPMIAEIADRLPAPRCAIIGEPSMMGIVNGHKGIATYEVEVLGHEAHSSLTHLGLSANMVAVRLMAELAALADALEVQAEADTPFVPPYATLTIGRIEGGTAGNILARRAWFLFDLRCPPGMDADTILAPFAERVAALDAELKTQFPDAGAKLTQTADAPPLAPQAEGDAEALVRSLTGDNGPAGAVAYAAEAGQFQRAGFPSVICGPGSIEQAHQPNEFIAIEQVRRGAAFMERLAEALVT